jgi:hypothetical protein
MLEGISEMGFALVCVYVIILSTLVLPTESSVKKNQQIGGKLDETQCVRL